MQKLLLVYYYSENRTTSRIWKVLPNMVFPPIWGKNIGALSMRMQVILDSLFARPGFSPYRGGGKKGEFRDWTTREYKELLLSYLLGITHYATCNNPSVMTPAFSYRVLYTLSNC